MNIENCGNCIYGKFIEKQPAGQCVRYPPVPLVVMAPAQSAIAVPNQAMTPTLTGAFPPIPREGYCGEFWDGGDAEDVSDVANGPT